MIEIDKLLIANDNYSEQWLADAFHFMMTEEVESNTGEWYDE